ncbi:phage major capsid protein [Fictibacillus sp. WQ 8-8]|uniref:phage major capsid protein n=1 Tax=Fictibacillus sp. WQ 8-8 TaxID=2938788 RepID=UPI003CD0CE95
MELRFKDAELRAKEDGTMTVSGYVNKTGQLSEVLGTAKRFVEKIAKGAFSKAISNAQRDIDFLAEHDSKQILSSTRNNSLHLKEDAEGLYMEATIAPTSYGKDYYELIKSGIHRNMSFGFRTVRDSWKSLGNGLFERTIEELELFEVSVVRDPAYSQSSIAARGINVVEEVNVPELKEEKRESEVDYLIEISKQQRSIENLRDMKKLGVNVGSLIEKEQRKLTQLQEEEKMIQELKKEIEELRVLQQTAQVTVGRGVQVDEIVRKAESTSSVFSKARKIAFTGAELQIPYETALGDADFVDEDVSASELALNLSNFAKLQKRRVAKAISLSKQLVFDSGTDLSSYSKELLARRTIKRIEKSILAGAAANEFKGIAPDTNVTSKNISNSAFVISELRKVYLAVNEDYVGNSSWYMSRAFYEKVAAATGGDGEYIVQTVKVGDKNVPTLFGHEIEISSALAAGNVGEVPVLFGSIADCYTVGVAKELEVKQVTPDTIQLVRGSIAFAAEFIGDGRVHNYDAIAKGTVTA